MKIRSSLWNLLAIGCIATLVSPLGSGVVGAAAVLSSERSVEITFRDGRHLRGALDGVGCSETLCSRVAVRGREMGASAVTRTNFDAIDRILSVGGGGAEIQLKDGTTHRMGIAQDNQVLYVVEAGRAQKVNLSRRPIR